MPSNAPPTHSRIEHCDDCGTEIRYADSVRHLIGRHLCPVDGCGGKMRSADRKIGNPWPPAERLETRKDLAPEG
jgi:hypothetical protein